ncbi:uncharacterized protein V6R79_007279 [Siganus canaliculatus]
MSFVRSGRSQQQQHSKGGKRPVRTKKAAAPKREWVSTVSDLSVHKLTPAELNHRHEIHKSHNKTAAQWELKEKALRRHFRHLGSPAPLDKASLSIIREVFSDQLLLQDVLSRSDRAMAVVKDLFGDAPHRRTGHPSVTMAPNCDSDSELPVLQRPDPPTQLSLLSQSMMDQQALNEVESLEEDCSDDDKCPPGSSAHHVIRRANLQKMKAQSQGPSKMQRKVYCPSSVQIDGDSVLATPATSGRAPDQQALNATVAVQRVQSRQNQSEGGKEESSVLVSQVLNPELPPNLSGKSISRHRSSRKCVSHSSELNGSSVTSLSGDQTSLGLLQTMLDQVEADLDTLSPDAEPATAQSPQQHRKQGLTGFSVALVSTLGRLVNVLKQREEEAHKASEERRGLEEELREQRGIVDALTAEMMTLREESTSLRDGLQRQTDELQQKLDTVVLVMGELGLLETDIEPHANSVCPSAAAAEQDPEKLPVTVSPAVLLSPPRQRDTVQLMSGSRLVPPHQELPRISPPQSCRGIPAYNSASSLSILPLSSLPSTSSLSLPSEPFSSHLSPEAILAEIAQLSRQNDLIQAQLRQAKSLSAGGASGGSPDSSVEQRRSSTSSSGKVTPQSVGERRTSVSSSTRRKSHVQTAERDTVSQTTSPNTSCVSGVEQRLLELNRQSAAARGRLLEVIEQQKQCVSAKVSPSASPIPLSAVSPPSAGREGSPEGSMMLSAQELLPQTDSSQRRYAGSEASSHSAGREIKAGVTQMRQQREGWFALSAHVR